MNKAKIVRSHEWVSVKVGREWTTVSIKIRNRNLGYWLNQAAQRKKK